MATTPRRKHSRPNVDPFLPKRSARGVACVVVIYGPDLGRRSELKRTAFEIGRSSKCDLSIDQESVSRHHARISFFAGMHVIEDLGSTNGTFVGDERVDLKRGLKHGDHIKVGRSILKYMSGDDLEQNYHEEIYRLMTVDALTQTFNKRYFNEALEREYNRSIRYQRDLSLVMVDLDHFKGINDAFGHVAGDSVLRQVAIAIKARLRAQDIFARSGGQEFAVLLPEVPLGGARVTAEKIRRIVETTAVLFRDKTIVCTASLGIAILGDGVDTIEGLLKAAQRRLLEAKSGGRNRVAG